MVSPIGRLSFDGRIQELGSTRLTILEAGGKLWAPPFGPTALLE
jgi:hypothetical protein